MRDRGWVNFVLHYAEDMNSFSSLPSGCLDAGFTIVSLLVSEFPPCPVLSHALKLIAIHITIRITIKLIKWPKIIIKMDFLFSEICINF